MQFVTALQKHLGDYYAAHVLRGQPSSVAASALKDLISKNNAAKEEAVKKLGELAKLDASTGGNLAKRCYVSHVQKKALEEALYDRSN